MLKPQSCSTECYKIHQATHTDASSLAATQLISYCLPPKPPTTAVLTSASNSHVCGGGFPFRTYSLSSLESSSDLQILHTRYPQLRCQLKEIYEAATEPLDNQLNDPSFSSRRCDRKRGQGRSRGRGRDVRTAATWSRNKGIKSGIHRLRMLRHLKGEDGDGLRAFSKVVTLKTKRSTTRLPET